MKKRDIPWDKKNTEVFNSFNRVKEDKQFIVRFYQHLFKVRPETEAYFSNVDFEKQKTLIIRGIEFALKSIQGDEESKTQMIRISKTHAKNNMDISPHLYYYWIEALVYTLKNSDPDWYDDLEYYWTEVITRPVSFMISQYYRYSERLV